METPPKFEIFISYRRDGGVDYARMIYLELKGRGYNTFFDFNSLRSGKFNENIFKAIDECRYFILVLSNGALDRCVNEDDWVRHEIEYALSKGKEIIPVCPSGNQRGFPESMPESFEPLRHVQISRLEMDDLFDKSFDKIVEDRFEDTFRLNRSPVSVDTAITVRSFKRVGLIVATVVFVSAAIVGSLILFNDPNVESKRTYATYNKMGYDDIVKLFDDAKAGTLESRQEVRVMSPDGLEFQGFPLQVAMKTLTDQNLIAQLITNNISSRIQLSMMVLTSGKVSDETLDRLVEADQKMETDGNSSYEWYRDELWMLYNSKEQRWN